MIWFVLNMMRVVLNTTGFVLIRTWFVYNLNNFADLNKTEIVLNLAVFVINIYECILSEYSNISSFVLHMGAVQPVFTV